MGRAVSELNQPASGVILSVFEAGVEKMFCVAVSVAHPMAIVVKIVPFYKLYALVFESYIVTVWGGVAAITCPNRTVIVYVYPIEAVDNNPRVFPREVYPRKGKQCKKCNQGERKERIYGP